MHPLRLLVALLVCASLAACGSPATAITNPDIDDLGWLVGDWVHCDGERHTWERWRPLNGSMVGRGSLEMAGETMSTEDLHIDRRDGVYVYIATPEGQSETEFPLARITENELIFDNPTHSHPQRIRYKLRNDGKLRVVISQLDGSQSRRWLFHRDACPPD